METEKEREGGRERRNMKYSKKERKSEQKKIIKEATNRRKEKRE